MTPTVKQMGPLLELIRRYESNDNYNAVWGGIIPANRPANLTGMTVGQVLSWQEDMRRQGAHSTAAGAYQFIYKTLNEIAQKTGADDGTKFDRAFQDRAAMFLLDRRGAEAWLKNEMPDDQFALALAMEWASLPVPFDVVRNTRHVKRGQSYYAGDGLNMAHATIGEVARAMRDCKGLVPPTDGGEDEKPLPRMKWRLWDWLRYIWRSS